MLAPVYWILAAVFIVIASRPRLRPLGIVGCVVLGLDARGGVVQRCAVRIRVGLPPLSSPARCCVAAATTSVRLTMVPAANLRMSGGGAPFELRGYIVEQHSDVKLRSITIRLTRRDCYEGAVDPSGCAKLWQDDY